METSNVRSIDSLRELRISLQKLAGDWDVALQQIRSSMYRTEEHFSTTMPAYWKHQTRLAEQKLSEARDNVSRQQGNQSSGQASAVTEAKQRVQLAKRRLDLCEEKYRLSSKIAVAFEHACHELAGPIAEATGHSSVRLPNAASHLAVMIGHLERYTEQPGSIQPTES